MSVTMQNRPVLDEDSEELRSSGKSLEIPGLIGPAQGSVDALKSNITRSSSVTTSRDARGIIVTPSEVVFEDVRAGLLFVLIFSVQNTSGETRRILLVPPSTPVFRLNYEPIRGLAPGLDVRAEVEFQLPVANEADDLRSPFALEEIREYVDKFIVVSGKDKIEVPLLARRPIPAVVHTQAVEFGTVTDDRTACSTVQLVNEGSRKTCFTITWDADLPLVFSPSEGVLEAGRGYRDTHVPLQAPTCEQPLGGNAATVEVTFDATSWSTAEPFRALATLAIPGQQDGIIDLSATVCKQKLKLLDAASVSATGLSRADFGTLYYGCPGEIKSILFNDGPEAAPFIASVEVQGTPGGQGWGGSTIGGKEERKGKDKHPVEVEPRDGTIPPYGRREITIRFLPTLPSRLSGFKGQAWEKEPLPSVLTGSVIFENAERKGDAVYLDLSGKGIRPTVEVTQKVVRFGACPCFERRDVVVGIKNTGQLPVRFNLSKMPSFSSTPFKGLLQPMQSQNTVLTFCPAQLGHFRGVIKLSLGGDAFVIPIRVVGEASTVGMKQPRPGGIDKLPADFKPKFNFVLSKTASGLRRAAEGRQGLRRPRPLETVDLFTSNSWDSTTHTVGRVGGADKAFNRLTFSTQNLVRREQDRRDSDAWLTAQRLKRSDAKAKRRAIRQAKAQGRDWRDPEGGVDIGMGRWMENEEPVPKLPAAHEAPLFLHMPLDGQGKGNRSADVKAASDMNKLISRKFNGRPATQAEARDCAAAVGREQLAKVDLHFRTVDFGQVTVGSSNVRNLAITNNLPHAVLAELVGLEGQMELAGSGPPAQVVPSGATAGFDMHFKCHTEQVFRKALKVSVNKGAVHQFNVLAHTVPVSVELDQAEVTVKFPPDSLESTLRHPFTLTNEGNAAAPFSWISRGAFSVSPEMGTISPMGKLDVEIVWKPQPGCKCSETLLLKVEGGQDKTLSVSGKLPEARCCFALDRTRTNSAVATSQNLTAVPPPPGDKGSNTRVATSPADGGCGGVLDFGWASVGVGVTRTVLLHNVGKSPAVFFVDTEELRLNGIDVQPARGLIEPKQFSTLTAILCATKELCLDGVVLSAGIRGGSPAKVLKLSNVIKCIANGNIALAGHARVPEVSVVEKAFEFGNVTAGGCESLDVGLVNRGLIPASLYLDLSQYPEFHLERASVSGFQPRMIGGGGGEEGLRGVQDERGLSRIEDIDYLDGDSPNTIVVSHSTGGKGSSVVPRQWNLLVDTGDTLRFKLVFLPERPGKRAFQFPLSFEGIPQDEAKHLRVPVSAEGLKPTLTFESTKVDFGRIIVCRDPSILKQYQGEFVLRNTSDKGLCWVIDDSSSKLGSNSEGIVNASAATLSPPLTDATDPGQFTRTLYVSPTSGQLSPGEESRVRLTFTPKRTGLLSFALPVWLERIPAKKTRPYITLRVQGFAVYPSLTFTQSPVELPVVPLSVTSRAVVFVENNGFSDMEVSHRLPKQCPVDIAVAFPDGRQVGIGIERIPVELSFRSLKPVSFNCPLDFYDAEGGHYPLPIRGCADNCLLTNYDFVEAYRGRFQFWAKDGEPVMFMNEAQIKAQETKDLKDRQAKRARTKAKKNAPGTKNQQQQQQKQTDASTSTAGNERSAVGAPTGGFKCPELIAAASDPAGTAGVASKNSYQSVDAGIDLSKAHLATGADKDGARMLCSWLNANVSTTYIEEFPGSIIEAHGRPALEIIEIMSGKPVPGQVWQKLRPPMTASGDGDGGSNCCGGGALRAGDRVTLLMDQYRRMLRFLGEKGCLVNSVCAEEFLGKFDYARSRTLAGEIGAGHRSPSAPANRGGNGEIEDDGEWAHRSRKAWSTVMYQCIRIFMLAGVTPRELSALPGVFIPTPSKQKTAKGVKTDKVDPELANSNVLSVGEGVLLRWLSYHLEQANKTSMPKRVSTFSDDLVDGAILCQVVASHAPHLAENGAPLHGFIPVHFTGELSDKSNRLRNVSKLLKAMTFLRIDFGLTVDDVLDLSDRDGMLLALHLFQALPQLVPKTEVEFRATLGIAVSKSIELKNPSSKPIAYEVTLEGSTDFRAKGSEVYLDPGKGGDFTVKLVPRFISPVEARLTFWAARNRGGMSLASNIVFTLKSKVENVEPISVSHFEGSCYEPQTIELQVSNPFEASARNAADDRFTVSLKQAMLSEHPSVMALARPGAPGARRGSLATARRRASTALPSAATSKSVASTTPLTSGGMNKSKEGIAARKGRGDTGGGGTEAAAEMNDVRAEVEAALKLSFHTDQELVIIPSESTAILTLLLLAFTPGEYKCTVVFWNERLGEFAQEVRATVGMPQPIAKLSFRVTAKDEGADGGGGGAVQRKLLLPSKNMSLQNALLGVLLERFQSDCRTRARQVMMSICSDLSSDRTNASTAVSMTTAEGSAALYVIEVDSPFFQPSRNTVLLSAPEPLGNGSGMDSNSVGQNSGGNGMTARNTARGVAPSTGDAGFGGHHKQQNLPKRAGLVDPASRRLNENEASPSEGAAGESVEGSGPGTPTQPETNAALLNFYPQAAGSYPCRILVMHRMKHVVDVRCVDIAATVDAPRNATTLVFRAPAGQTITQEIPIHNNGEVAWMLNAGPRQPPFGGLNQLLVPAHGMASYPLMFSPLRACEDEFTSKLVLTDTKDSNRPVTFEFNLRGTAEEPLAETHRVIRCPARERVEETFTVKNATEKDLEYTVDSDLPEVTGSPSVTVLAKSEVEYKLSMCPKFTGVFTGSLTFMAPGGIITWYTVEIQASNPMEEDVVSISTVLRQAVSVEISLSNPLQEELRFHVSLEGEGLLGHSTFTLEPSASSTYTLYYSPLRVQSHSGSIIFSAEAVGELWYRLELRADPCPPVRLDEVSCPVGTSCGTRASIDNPVGREIVLASKSSNNRNFSIEPEQVVAGPYGTTQFQVVYTPSSLGKTEHGEVILTHPELGDWVFEASGFGEMPGVMGEHRAVAVIGSASSTMFPFRNPFPEPLLLTIVLKVPAEQSIGEVNQENEVEAQSTQSSKRGKDDNSQGNGKDRIRTDARVPFVLLLKKTTDLVLQPFQSLQIPMSFLPEVIVEERACVEVRGQLGGRSLTWVFPVVGVGEAPGGLRMFSISCPAKSSTREDFEVELVGLAGVQNEEEFEFEVALPEDVGLKRALDRALNVVPITAKLSDPQQLLKFQVSLEPLKPFRTIVEVVVKRKTGGGRWRYEVKVEATEADPDDHIPLRAPVGGQSSAMFRLCNRYLGYAPFQAYFTADSALSLSVEPLDGVLVPFGTEGTPVTVTYAPTQYMPNQKGRLIVETEDIRWSYAVTGNFPGFRPPTGVSKVDTGSHSSSRSTLRGRGGSTPSLRTLGGKSSSGGS